MAGGLALFHREAGVEQQHAILGPLHQTAARLWGRRKRGAQVALHLFEDVAQRGRQRHTRRDRKRQPLGLAPAMVRVLPQDDHAHGVGRGEVERAQRLGRKNRGPGLQARLQESQQRLPARIGKEGVHQRLPAGCHRPVGRVGALQLRGGWGGKIHGQNGL
ncbi:hypothetical protein D3C87_1503940 [compost metagenome]